MPLLSWVPVEGDPQNLSNMRGFYSTFGEEENRVREGSGQPKATQLRRTEIKIDPSQNPVFTPHVENTLAPQLQARHTKIPK